MTAATTVNGRFEPMINRELTKEQEKAINSLITAALDKMQDEKYFKE